jgi:hypothetical protein
MATPGQAEAFDQSLEDADGPAGGVQGARPEPTGQGEAGVALEGQQRQVLVLAVIAVVGRQRLPAVRGVVGGVDVEDELSGWRGAGADEQINEEVVASAQALDLGAALLQKRGALFARQLRVFARVGVEETVERRGGGQRPVGVGHQPQQDLEESVGAGVLGVVAVGVSGQELIDELNEQGLQRVLNVARRARVGQAGGQVGENAEGNVELSHGEQSGVLDKTACGEVNNERLRADRPGHRVAFVALCHDLSLRGVKWLVLFRLTTA